MSHKVRELGNAVLPPQGLVPMTMGQRVSAVTAMWGTFKWVEREIVMDSLPLHQARAHIHAHACTEGHTLTCIHRHNFAGHFPAGLTPCQRYRPLQTGNQGAETERWCFIWVKRRSYSLPGCDVHCLCLLKLQLLPPSPQMGNKQGPFPLACC